jgi:hypothetical protein
MNRVYELVSPPQRRFPVEYTPVHGGAVIVRDDGAPRQPQLLRWFPDVVPGTVLVQCIVVTLAD